MTERRKDKRVGEMNKLENLLIYLFFFFLKKKIARLVSNFFFFFVLLLGFFFLVGVGFLCAWAVLKSFQSGVAEIIPIRDPRIRESINHHE